MHQILANQAATLVLTSKPAPIAPQPEFAAAPEPTAVNSALGMVLLFAPLLLLAGLGRMPGKLLLPLPTSGLQL